MIYIPSTVASQGPYSSSHRCMQELTFLEFFAGRGRVWKGLRVDSVNTVGIDICYVENEEGGQNPFDILSCAGMGFYPQLFMVAVSI